MKRIKLGLIGWPVEHSISPQLQSAALKSAGLEGEYRLYPVPPSPGAANFDSLLSRLRTGEIQGLNVTIPHKRIAFEKVDRLTPTAQAVGAVNTLYINEGALWGENTDVGGFIKDLDGLVENNRRALVLGAGGAARAVAYGLAQAGWAEIFVAARRLGQVEQLVAHLAAVQAGGPGEANILRPAAPTARFVPLALHPENLAGIAEGWDLVVNATSAGMAPQVDASPWPGRLPWPDPAAAYDLVYNPTETVFLRKARAAGVPTRGGIGMLVEQAALAFECWTGKSPSRRQMRANL